MELATATLLAASIAFAGDVVSATISRTSKEVSGPTVPGQGATHTHKESVTVIREQVLNKQFLTRVINQTAEHFSKLLDEKANEIIQEMRTQPIKEAVQEVQAQVKTLHNLLSLETTDDPNLVMQLVLTALNPLQVKIEIAKLRLKDCEHQEAWQYCYIIGTSALIAGYSFLGQDAPHLREELESVIMDIKSQMLDEIAAQLISSGQAIPWERVPELLASEGTNDLLELFNSTLEQFPPISYDVNNMTIDEIRSAIYKITDKRILDQILSQEKMGKARTGAITAIRGRIREL